MSRNSASTARIRCSVVASEVVANMCSTIEIG
jgi:hypothetical protein